MLKKADIASITKGIGRVYLKEDVSICRVVSSKTKKTPRSSRRLGEGAEFDSFTVECVNSRGKKCVRAEVDRGTLNGEPFLDISFGGDRKHTVQIGRV